MTHIWIVNDHASIENGLLKTNSRPSYMYERKIAAGQVKDVIRPEVMGSSTQHPGSLNKNTIDEKPKSLLKVCIKNWKSLRILYPYLQEILIKLNNKEWGS